MISSSGAAAGEGHRQRQLVAQDLEDALDAVRAVDRQAPQRRPPDGDQVARRAPGPSARRCRAERRRRPPAAPRSPTAVGDLGQRVDGGDRGVELPPAVVADPDAVAAGLDGARERRRRGGSPLASSGIGQIERSQASSSQSMVGSDHDALSPGRPAGRAAGARRGRPRSRSAGRARGCPGRRQVDGQRRSPNSRPRAARSTSAWHAARSDGA